MAAVLVFLGVCFAQQVAGSAVEAMVTTGQAQQKANSLCDQLSSAQTQRDRIQEYFNELKDTTYNLEKFQTEIDAVQDMNFLSKKELKRRRVVYYFKLGLAVILGILTTYWFYLFVLNRSLALESRFDGLQQEIQHLRKG